MRNSGQFARRDLQSILTAIAPYLLYAALVFFVIRVVQYSWVTDDGFITFRSVLNFAAGDGPVFNIGERVQSFTHPLWFMLLCAGGMLDINLYFFAILLGISLSLILMFVLAKLCSADASCDRLDLAVALVFLASSEAFVSFSTSGLENSLSNLLLATCVLTVINNGPRLLFYLTVALAMMNRFDNIFILAPMVLLVLAVDYRANRIKAGSLLLGFAPLALWHTFSVAYYGFVFPNTKYAKIGERGVLETVSSGLHYTFDFIQSEPHVILAFLFLPLALKLPSIQSDPLNTSGRNLARALYVGILMQLVYVVFISGGDFMRGRFYTTAITALAIIYVVSRPRLGHGARTFAYASAVVLFIVSAWIGHTERIAFPAPGVANERNFYKQFLAVNLDPSKNYTQHNWAVNARNLNVEAKAIIGMNGQRAYWVPRQVDLIDLAGLSDPFIARLQIRNSDRTGHFERNVPEEYLAARTSGEAIKGWKDANAEALFERITIVTRSKELFSLERLRAMLWVWLRYGI